MRTDVRGTAFAIVLAMAALPLQAVTAPAAHAGATANGPSSLADQAARPRATSTPQATPVVPKPAVLLDTFNADGTLDGPSQPAVFSIRQAHRISLVQTYHWNGGRGARPGTVGFRREDGRQFGPWPCTGTSGQGGVPCFWSCAPDAVIPPGSYEIQVSSPASWSHNPASRGRGFVRVEGLPSDLPGTPEAAAAPAATLRVKRATSAQTVTLDDRLSITLPASLLRNDQVITVAEIPRDQQLIGDGDLYFLPINAFSVSIGSQHQFKDEITLSFRYDPADLNPKYSAADQIMAHHWDESRRLWSPVPSTVDAATRTVHVRTRHLSLFSCAFTAVGLAKLAALTAGAAAAVYVGHHAYEKVWLDNHRSPSFLIYYSDGDVNGRASPVNDTTWWPAGRTSQTYRAGSPRYVQDLAGFLEEALRKYQAAGFVPPPLPIVVKINSALVKYQANPAGYEHRSGRIHVNTALARQSDRVKQITAHELFHAVQSGDRAVVKWWEESTAEYASCQVAWNLRSLMGGGSTADIDPKLLSVPMPHTGVVSNGLGEVEYDKGYFVAHLVARGADFAGLWRVVAGSSGDTQNELLPIDRHLKARGAATLGQMYRGFVGDLLFSQSSPLGSGDPSRDSADRQISLPLPATPGQLVPPVHVEYNLPAGLTTRLVAITAKTAAAQKTRKVAIGLSTRTSDTHADVYLLAGNVKSAGRIAPTAALEKPGDSAILELGPNDVAYVALTNTSFSDDGTARISVGDFSVALSISPPAIKEPGGKLDHAFTATGTPIPAGVRQLSYRWDYGDKSAREAGVCQTPSGGSVSFTGTHKYARGGHYTVVAELFDASSETLKLMATASARVEIIEVASITLAPVTGQAGERVSIQANGAGLPARVSWVWDFGDGSPPATTSTPGVAHRYAAAGQYTASVRALDAVTRALLAQAKGPVSIAVPSQPPAAGRPADAKAAHLSAIGPAGDGRTTIVCDLAGSTQHFVTKKMLNYPDPPFEIGLHDKGTTVIDSTHRDFGPAEYKLFKVQPPKTYMDYMMNRSIAVTLVETLVVR